jgi:hypothetical protein
MPFLFDMGVQLDGLSGWTLGADQGARLGAGVV